MNRTRKTPLRPRGRREPRRAPEQPEQPVDDGRRASVPSVLAEVGNDPDKARDAYDAEANSDRPRSTLLNALDRIIGKDDDQ